MIECRQYIGSFSCDPPSRCHRTAVLLGYGCVGEFDRHRVQYLFKARKAGAHDGNVWLRCASTLLQALDDAGCRTGAALLGQLAVDHDLFDVGCEVLLDKRIHLIVVGKGRAGFVYGAFHVPCFEILWLRRKRS